MDLATRALQPSADLNSQPLDEDLTRLLGTLLANQRLQVALESQMLLAPRALFKVPIYVGLRKLVDLTVEVEMQTS